MTALDIDPYAFAKASGWEGQIVPFPGEGDENFRTITVRGETVTLMVAQGLGGYYAPVNDKGQILTRPPQVGDLLHYLPDILGWMGQPTRLRPEALLTPGWAKTWPGKYSEQNHREAEERRAAREAKATKPTSAAAPATPSPAAPVKAKVSFGSPSPSSPAAPAPIPVLDPVVEETGLLFLRRAEITWDQWFQEVLAFAEGGGNPSLIAHGLAAGLPLVRPTDPNRVDFRKSKFTAPLGRPPGS